ncbi:MAG TPA: hypothetical protein VGA29_08100, partial [Ignavibacteriaceae bacterium]
VSGNPGQYDDINIFLEEQELMKNLISKSILPVLEVDVSGNNISKAADKIADWMKSTGGLWAR